MASIIALIATSLLLRQIRAHPSAQIGPEVFQANPGAVIGGGRFKDSPRFRIYNYTDDAKASTALNNLEAAYSCFVDGPLQWRSSGLSFNAKDDNVPYMKMNLIAVNSPKDIGGAAGVMGSDPRTGHSFIKVVNNDVARAEVTVHEYGHSLTYYERTWVDMGRTGTWWETVAQYVADTFITSPLCADVRAKYKIPDGRTLMNVQKVLSTAHQVIVDGTPASANHYEAWPFLTYLTNNPDNIAGLGKTGVRDMFRKYKVRSNETPLHALDHVVSPTSSAQKVVARYWARMAFVDIGHEQAARQFATVRAKVNYANLDSIGEGSWKVKEARSPKYMGANIIPLKNISGAEVSVKITGQGAFTAIFAARSKSRTTTYTEVLDGSGYVKVGAGDEVSLVVVNTPKALIMYDGFRVAGSEAAKGLSYTVEFSGASA